MPDDGASATKRSHCDERSRCPVAEVMMEAGPPGGPAAQEDPQGEWRDLPGSCGLMRVELKSEEEEQRTIPPEVWRMFRSSPAANRRASLVYLVVGLGLCGVSLCGFAPAVYWRLRTGQWWRDPVNIRLMPLPAGIDWVVCAHGATGIAWLLFLAQQLLSGAVGFCPAQAQGQLRAVHRYLGKRSAPLAYTFFLSSAGILLTGLCSEPVGRGWNSPFVRFVQFCAVALAFLLYFLGLYQATCRNYALHKDCMMGSMLYTLVPTGVPRFFRDTFQWWFGENCNVSNTPEVWFFMCCIYCILGWPALFIVTRRFFEHDAFRILLKVNAALIVIMLAVFRPDLHVDPCVWESAGIHSAT